MGKIEKLKKEREELDKKIETLEYAESMFEEGDEVYYVDQFGNVTRGEWNDSAWVDGAFLQGHIFRTKQEAETETKRRNLLTRFRAFRDECNDGWKPNWSGNEEMKAYIQYHEQFNTFVIKYTLNRNILQTFGFFKCKQDAERAIELFGDEIKKLFIDCECD